MWVDNLTEFIGYENVSDYRSEFKRYENEDNFKALPLTHVRIARMRFVVNFHLHSRSHKNKFKDFSFNISTYNYIAAHSFALSL